MIKDKIFPKPRKPETRVKQIAKSCSASLQTSMKSIERLTRIMNDFKAALEELDLEEEVN